MLLYKNNYENTIIIYFDFSLPIDVTKPNT